MADTALICLIRYTLSFPNKRKIKMNMPHFPQLFKLSFMAPISLFILPFLLSACGGGDGNSSAIAQIPNNKTAVALTILQNNKSFAINTINNSAITIQDDEQIAPYLYQQFFNRIENKFQKSYRFTYKFNVNSTKYELLADYDDLKKQPSSLQLSNKTNLKDEYFICHNDAKPCQNITLNINERSGQTTLKFNNTSLYDDTTSVVLNGELSGQLSQSPLEVNIPNSLQHQLIAANNINLNNSWEVTNTHYQKMIFTNHNQIYLATNTDELSPIEIHIFDNQVKKATYYSNYFLHEMNWAFDASINANNPPIYDPKNYIVSFNDTNLHTTNAILTLELDRYLKGNIGP